MSQISHGGGALFPRFSGESQEASFLEVDVQEETRGKNKYEIFAGLGEESWVSREHYGGGLHIGGNKKQP